MLVKKFGAIFIRGLFTLLPVAVTIYILYSAVIILETLLGSQLSSLMGDAYIPGIGFLATILTIFLFGLMLNSFIMSRLLEYIEQKFTSIPIVKAIYSPLKDLTNMFNRKEGFGHQQRVVFVQIGEMKLMGLVTREHFDDLNLSSQTENRVAVYIPLSYGLGGYTVLAQKESLTEVDLPIEKALSLAITGWVKAESRPD
jgi:uncharacterized membrane protein